MMPWNDRVHTEKNPISTDSAIDLPHGLSRPMDMRDYS